MGYTFRHKVQRRPMTLKIGTPISNNKFQISTLRGRIPWQLFFRDSDSLTCPLRDMSKFKVGNGIEMPENLQRNGKFATLLSRAAILKLESDNMNK